MFKSNNYLVTFLLIHLLTHWPGRAAWCWCWIVVSVVV